MLKKVKRKITLSFKNYHPTKFLSYLYFIIPIYIAIYVSFKINNDFWFLVNTGKHIRYHGFPTIEPFTIHNNLSFVVQQWLTDYIYYLIYSTIGCFGIAILTFVQFLIILILTYKLCLLVSDNRRNLSVIITTIITILICLFVTSRPQMFDYIILLLLIYLLELYIRKKNKKYLFFLPLLSFLQINLHCSSWFMLYAFMLPYLINSFRFKILFLKSDGYEKKWLFIILIIMFIVGFFNPYGIEAITYLFKSYGNIYINSFISEMIPINISNILGFLMYATIFSVLFVYSFYKQGNIKVRYFLLYIGTAYLSIKSVKGFSFFIIASIYPLCDYVKDRFIVYKNNYKHSTKFKLIYSLLVTIILVPIIIYIYFKNPKLSATSLNNIADYLDKVENADKTNSKIYTSYNDGGYIQFREFKTYIDARAEIFLRSNNKKSNILKEYFEIQTGKRDIDKFLKKYNFDYIILDEDDYLYEQYLKKKKNDNYKLIYKDEKSKIYLYKNFNSNNK